MQSALQSAVRWGGGAMRVLRPCWQVRPLPCPGLSGAVATVRPCPPPPPQVPTVPSGRGGGG
jgi:hypothetical protein